MTRSQSREKLIHELLCRNLYLESVIFGASPPDFTKVFSSPMIFIVKENDTGKIIGVFSDEKSADSFSAESFRDSSVHPWVVSVDEHMPVPAIILPNGTKIIADDSGKKLYGEIMSSDEDLKDGIQNVLYKVLPKGLQNDSSDYIVIAHHEIKDVLDDNFEK